MSTYEERDKILSNAFIHLVEDSSDEDETEERVTSSLPIDQPINDDRCDIKDEAPDPRDQEISLIDTTTSDDVHILDLSDDDCKIIQDDNSDSDDIEVLDTSHLSTRSKSYRKFTPEKRRCSQLLSSQDMDLTRLSEDDHEFRLKIMISGQFTVIKTTYSTKLSIVLEKIVADLNSRNRSLIVRHNRKEISFDESPQSLSLMTGDILDAIDVPTKSTSSSSGKHSGPLEHEAIDPDVIRVKLQDDNRKHSREFTINKHDSIVRLKEYWSNEYNIDIASIKLCFDGDVLSDDSTPEDADIDDGCAIDVLVARSK